MTVSVLLLFTVRCSLSVLTDVTVGLANQLLEINETQGAVEVCVEIIIGTLERNVTVYIYTVSSTGKQVIMK